MQFGKTKAETIIRKIRKEMLVPDGPNYKQKIVKKAKQTAGLIDELLKNLKGKHAELLEPENVSDEINFYTKSDKKTGEPILYLREK